MIFFFFSSRRRHTRSTRDWSSDVCSSDLGPAGGGGRFSGGHGGTGGAGGGGTAGGAGDRGAIGGRGAGLPAGAGLRKNDGRPAGSCPSTIRPDYGRNRRGESTFRGSGTPAV